MKCNAETDTFSNKKRIVTWISFTKYSLGKRGLAENDLAAVIIHSDSMCDTLKPNDCVVINLNETRPDGGIFVLRVGEMFLVKRLMSEKNHIRVISDNDRYADWFLVPDDDFEILGKYEWLGRYAG